MDHDIVTQQAHAAAALDDPLGNHTAGHLANLGDAEHLADFGITDEIFLRVGAEKAAHGRLHLVDQFIDDRMIADFHAVALRQVTRLRNGPHIEADNKGVRGNGKRDVGFADRADTCRQDADLHLVSAKLLEGHANGLKRAMDIRLDDNRQLFSLAGGNRRQHLLDRSARPARRFALLDLAGAVFGNLAGPRLGFDNHAAVAGHRCAIQTENFDRLPRAC